MRQKTVLSRVFGCCTLEQNLALLAMIFLCGYANGHRRSRDSAKNRIPQWLPEPEWLLKRLEEAGLMSELRKAARSALFVMSARVQAIALLGPGICYQGRLTPWTQEAEHLWQYWKCPAASFSLDVQDRCSLVQPVTISSARGCSGNVGLKHILFQANTPVVDGTAMMEATTSGERMPLSEWFRRNGRQDLLHLLPDVPILFVPEVVLLLLIRKKWDALVLNAYNHHIQKQHASALLCLQQTVGFLQLQIWRGLEILGATRSRCQRIAVFLLEKQASAILASCNSGAQANSVRKQLEDAAEALQHFLLSCDKRAQGGVNASNFMLSAAELVNAIRFARYVRNRSKINIIKDSVIEAFVPEGLQGLVRKCAAKAPSGTSISRAQAIRFLMFLIS